jgi:hypothetical protein
VFPVLPGETTLNAASTLASQGTLELPLVILAGALGAIFFLRERLTAAPRGSRLLAVCGT